ncbi:SCO family protein [Cohnella massiliensis]|uniref:SCO family protein n=1 Tax=Cohnella massiliensis TaxID=1816691 RepID=UPI001593F603|nr:SCO family protein [Cohnella massiliensis]
MSEFKGEPSDKLENATPETAETAGTGANGPSAPTVGTQKSFARRYAFPMVLLALCLALGGYLLWDSMKGSDLPVQGEAADFTLQSIDGEAVTMSELDGKVRLVYFFFSNCPDVCPPTTFMLSQVQEKLKADGDFGDKVEFLSITIDPLRDTPEALRAFGDKFNADYAGWKFLRGDEEQPIWDLAQEYGLMVVKDQNGDFGHSNLVVLVDKKGQIRSYISPDANGNPGDLDADALYEQVKTLL